MKKAIFWLVQFVDDAHRARAALLDKYDFEVTFFETQAALEAKARKSRVGIFFFSDNGSPKAVQEALFEFLKLPLLAGAHLVLIVNRSIGPVEEVAASNGFVDIIPIDLSDRLFAFRVTLACNDKGDPFPSPVVQVPHYAPATLKLPARIISADMTKVQIETALGAVAGTSLDLAGPLVDSLGLRSVSVNVEAQHTTGLRYHFPYRLECIWQMPADRKEKALRVLEGLQMVDVGRPILAFIAVQSRELRSSLIDKFHSGRIEPTFALRVRDLTTVPELLNPDIMMIEASLVEGKMQAVVLKALESVKPDVPIVFLGSLKPELDDKMHEQFGELRVYTLEFVPANLEKIVIGKYLKPEATQKEGVTAHFGPHDLSSYARISIPASVERLHPRVLGIKTLLPLNKGALGKLEAPLLKEWIGTYSWVKLCNPAHDEFLMLNLGRENRETLRKRVLEIASKKHLSLKDLVFALPKQEVKLEVLTEYYGAEEVADVWGEALKDNSLRFLSSRRLRFYAMYIAVVAILGVITAFVLPAFAKRFAETGGMYGQGIMHYAGSEPPPDEKAKDKKPAK